jgi:hypothetical protein
MRVHGITVTQSLENVQWSREVQRIGMKKTAAAPRALGETLAFSAFIFHADSLADNAIRQGSTLKRDPRQTNPKMFLFFSNVHQKSVNKGQIIPVFTLIWDDN